MAHHRAKALVFGALVVTICIVTSLALLVSIDSVRDRGWSDLTSLFLSCVVFLGTIGTAGLLCRKNWGVFFSIVFGFCILALVFPIGTLSPNARLLALGVGVAIVIAAVNVPSFTTQDPIHTSRGPTYSKALHERLRMAEMAEGSESIEALKYNLERERFLWEVATHRRENTFLTRHFGVIITAIVSFAAVMVSYLQLTISLNNARTQIDNESLKNDRQFYLEMAKFLLDSRQELTTRDNERALYLRSVVVAAFPTEAAIQISTNMRDAASTNDIRKIWDDAVKLLQVRRTRPASR